VIKKRRHSCKEINEFVVIENVTVGNLLSVSNTSWLFDELNTEITPADVQKIATEMLVVVNGNYIFFCKHYSMIRD
jgi:hypothetical protein